MNIHRTEQEAERRQRQIETLQSSLIHLQTQFTNAAKDMQRVELLGNGNRPSLWEEDDDDEAMADLRPSGSNNKYSVQDYRKQQTKILDDQNEGLEALAKVISRQKHLALRIGDEVEEQNGMLGNLLVAVSLNAINRMENSLVCRNYRRSDGDYGDYGLACE